MPSPVVKGGRLIATRELVRMDVSEPPSAGDHRVVATAEALTCSSLLPTGPGSRAR